MKEAIILAGGFGTRLQHVVSDLPKPMAPIKGQPFLNYLLDYLLRYEVEHVVFSTGYLHENIVSHCHNFYKGINISYAREIEPLGTGGAIKFALSQCEQEDVLVLNGDTLFSIDLHDFYSFYEQKKTNLAIALRQVEDVVRYGSVQVDEEGKIIRFTEKNEQIGKGYINGGIYYMSKQLMQIMPEKENFSFEKEVMEKYCLEENFYAKPYNSYFIDIGIPEDYQRAQEELPKVFSFING